ncbi:TDT family transporter [Clostridium sp. DSM 100503]|uniref:TDT family transporter n=1 Tax=Clostridium sp. DSM 100503 TaxID=2963282 RepID=UPI00214A5BFF|nr:TDT family transporter [Clostridium sp. DSM 100503]MCR1949655.1 TDT family transporter [Clostridium sp. DSM 100503]
MKNNLIFRKIENLPVPILPTMVGAATLSNIYSSLGYTWVRHLTMWIATCILIVYLVKILAFYPTCKKEYSNTVPASLYAGITMITMILGSYYFDYNNSFGKILWLIGLILHAIHIIIFTYRNVIKGVNEDTFVPSWFVTYNGIMVSTVVGSVMKEPLISKIVLYYGILVLLLILPFMIIRLRRLPLKEAFFHTQAILLAPSSLCVVSYINVVKEPNKIVLYLLYILVVITLLFVVYKLPKFFSYKFTPAFAGLTFPMAIGTLASIKISGFLINEGYEVLGNITKQISGIQIYITTAIISFVLFNFFTMFMKSFKEN